MNTTAQPNLVHRPRKMRVEHVQMPVPKPPQSRKDFGVALICALMREADAVMDVFDHIWDENIHGLGQARGDDNSYTAGVIEGHNVVLVHMPGMGAVDAGAVAGGLRASFPDLDLALVVGICGGVPERPHQPEIYLGDLIVSTAIVQYDYGRQTPGSFITKNTLEENHGRPNNQIRGFQAKLQNRWYSQRLQAEILQTMLKLQECVPEARHPGLRTDQLHSPTYLHKHRPPRSECDICSQGPDEICPLAFDLSCSQLGCDPGRVRNANDNSVVGSSRPPTIHFGRIGSGNAVIKSGAHREQIAQKHGLIGFEMEGVGVWNQFPTIIIKSVCDYADSHKNKDWQNYSAAIAAAGMKAILKAWSPRESRPDENVPIHNPHPLPTTTRDDGTGAHAVIFNNHGTVGRQVGTENIYGDQHNTMNF